MSFSDILDAHPELIIMRVLAAIETWSPTERERHKAFIEKVHAEARRFGIEPKVT